MVAYDSDMKNFALLTLQHNSYHQQFEKRARETTSKPNNSQNHNVDATMGVRLSPEGAMDGG